MYTITISEETQKNIKEIIKSAKLVAIIYLIIKLIKFTLEFIVKIISSLRTTIQLILIIGITMVIIDETTKLNTIKRTEELLKKYIKNK